MNLTIKTQGNRITATADSSKLFEEPMLTSEDKLYESDEMFEFILTEKQAFAPKVEELINEGLIKVSNEEGVYYAAIDRDDMAKLNSLRPSNDDIVTRAAPTVTRSKPPVKRTKSMRERKFNLLKVSRTAKNLVHTLIDDNKDHKLRFNIAVEVATMYVDSRFNYSKLSTMEEFMKEHREFMDFVPLKNKTYKRTVKDPDYRLDKFSFDGHMTSKELIGIAKRLNSAAVDIKKQCGDNYISSELVKHAWKCLDVLRFPDVENFDSLKKFHQHLGVENGIDIAETLHGLRQDYADMMMSVPRVVNGQLIGRHKPTEDFIETIVKRSYELYEKHGLDMLVHKGFDPKDYRNIEITPVVTDRIKRLI